MLKVVVAYSKVSSLLKVLLHVYHDKSLCWSKTQGRTQYVYNSLQVGDKQNIAVYKVCLVKYSG